MVSYTVDTPGMLHWRLLLGLQEPASSGVDLLPHFFLLLHDFHVCCLITAAFDERYMYICMMLMKVAYLTILE